MQTIEAHICIFKCLSMCEVEKPGTSAPAPKPPVVHKFSSL